MTNTMYAVGQDAADSAFDAHGHAVPIQTAWDFYSNMLFETEYEGIAYDVHGDIEYALSAGYVSDNFQAGYYDRVNVLAAEVTQCNQ